MVIENAQQSVAFARMAMVRFPDDTICDAEVHWYDAHGVGKKEIKIKHIFWQ